MYQLKRIYNEAIEETRWREGRRRAKAWANRDKLKHHNGSQTVGETRRNQGRENAVCLDSGSGEEGAMIYSANVTVTYRGREAVAIRSNGLLAVLFSCKCKIIIDVVARRE
jgi:hypothetical protein